MTAVSSESSLDLCRQRLGEQNRLHGGFSTRAFLIACITLAVIQRLNFIHYPFPNDGALYICLGRCIAQGGKLYVDIFDTKLPGVALFTAACWRVFGSYWPGYVLLQLAMSLASSLMLARAAGYFKGASPVAVFALSAFFLNFGPAVGTGFQLETVQVFFESLSALASARALHQITDARKLPFIPLLTAGLAGGCAAMIKPGGAAVIVAFILAVACAAREFKIKSIAILALGFLLPWMGVLGFVVQSGITGELPNVFRQISLYSSQTPRDWGMVFKPLIVSILLGFPLLVRGWVFRRDVLANEKIESIPLLFLVLWLVFELTGVMLQTRMYTYYFLVMIPPAAMLFGLPPRRERFAHLFFPLLPVLVLSWWWCNGRLRMADPGDEPVTAYLAAHCRQGDSIFIDQGGRALLQTGLQSGSRLLTTFYFLNYDQAPVDYCQILLKDFEQHKPKYIVLACKGSPAYQIFLNNPILKARPERQKNMAESWQKMRNYTERHYRLESSMDGQEIWRRR